MKDTPLNRFIEEVMGINAGFPGLGGAEAAIFGAASTNDQVIVQLRGAAIAFATEYAKQDRNVHTLAQLGGTVEGSLRSVKLMGGLSDAKFDGLMIHLHELLERAEHK